MPVDSLRGQRVWNTQPARRVGRGRDLTLQPDPVGPLAVERWHGGEQRLGIRMVRPGEDGLGRPDLHHPPEIQHDDAVGQVPDQAQVVGDEQVGGLLFVLQVGQQVEDGRLDRDVERRGRFVADHHLGPGAEGARDRDPLLEPARELARAQRQVPVLQPHRGDQLFQPVAQGRSREPGQPGQRTADQAAHRMPAVKRRVGVLEHDLERAQGLPRPPPRVRAERGAVQGDDRALVRRYEPEQDARQRGLAAARLAHQPERLASPDGQVHSGQGLDAAGEGLRQPLDDHQRAWSPVVRGRGDRGRGGARQARG